MDDAHSTLRPAVLVVGGAGFVGSHACKALALAGYQPVVYDNLSRGHAHAVQWGPLVRGDILDTASLIATIRDYRARAVMHFAAYSYVGESMAEPGMYWRNNVSGTVSLLEAMRQTNCSRLVFSSSCAVYGDGGGQLMEESLPYAPTSPYGKTKQVCEEMMRDQAQAHGLSTIALRYFNAAGADPDGAIGEDHEPEPHIIPNVLRVAAGLDACLTVNGRDYATPDGTCVRDYVHVSDLADAHVLALARALRGPAGFEAYNLGTGRGHSLDEIVAAARRVTGREVPVRYGQRRPGDPSCLIGGAGKAREELGWEARRSELDTMLLHAWNWMLARNAEGVRDGRLPATADR